MEILKALYRDAEILILDEPTAVLTPQETRELFATLRSLARSGRAIIFITHKLREVLAVSDRISVMRLGRIIATMNNKEVTAEEIANLMVGRAVLLRVAKGEAKPTPEPLLTVDGLTVAGDRGETAVDDLSLSVRAGEIVGLAGVQGNGQDELVEAITGLRRPLSGAIEVCGTPLRHADPRAARAAGLAYVPADRGRVGLSLLSRVWENLTLGHQRELSRGPLLASRRRPPSRRRPDPQLRHPRRRRGHARRLAFGRQPAEGPARPRADPQRAADRRRAAFAGRRHRRDRGDPPHARADARRRPGGAS